MNPKPSLYLAAICLAAPVCHAEVVFSWETGTEGWFSSNAAASVATSPTSPTDGVQSLQVIQPMSAMWYNDSTRIQLDAAQRLAVFDGAQTITLDVTYPNPGYNSWWVAPTVEMVIEDQGFTWNSLGTRPLTVDGTATCSWSLTPPQAAAFANGTSAKIILRFVYGNGGATGTNAVFYIDKLTSTDPPPPPPFTSNFYWKGSASASWADNNWTTAEDGVTATPALLPNDGTEAVAFSATGAANLSTVLGADQNVLSLNFTGSTGEVSIGGTHNLLIGPNGITANNGSGAKTINTSGQVTLDSNQSWRNNSVNPLTVSSQIDGVYKLTIGGTGTTVLSAANLHSGGTGMLSGRLEMGNALALGPVDAMFTADGGTLDLMGFNPTLGGISGGGIITNTVVGTSTLTVASVSDTTYIGKLNDGAADQIMALTKSGASILTLGGLSSFTGNVLVSEGILVANQLAPGIPVTSTLGNSQFPGRTVTVASGAALRFTRNNIFGNQDANHSLLPAIIINGGTVECTSYNSIGNITLNGGTLSHTSVGMNYQGFQFKGIIEVLGTTPSLITSGNGYGNHLAAETVFNVSDVTGSAAADLSVTAPLLNQSGDFGSAAGTLVKTGAGKMIIGGGNSYTGSTRVEDGALGLTGASALSDIAPLIVYDGASLQIDSGSEFVGSLIFRDEFGVEVAQDYGTYGGPDSDAETIMPTWTGLGVILVSSDPFPAWIASYPGLNVTTRAKEADPDADGLTNLMEFAFNGNPVSAQPSGKVRSRFETVGGQQALVITFLIRDGAVFTGNSPAVGTVEADHLVYRVEGSNNLGDFDQTVSEILVVDEETLPLADAGWAYHSFRLNGDIDGPTPRGPAGFIRVGVDEAPAAP